MAEDFFLERKKTPSIEVDNYSDFSNEDIESDLHSCGLGLGKDSTFDKRNDLFFKDFKEGILNYAGKTRNPVEIVASSLERHFSSREISYLLSKSVLSSLIKNSKKKENK